MFDVQILSEVIHKLSTEDRVRIPMPEGTTSEGINATHMEFSLTYNKGGGYRNTKRGFYLAVQPIEMSDGFVRTVPLNGVRGFVSPEPITRVSKAARKAAHGTITTDLLERYLGQTN